MSSVSINRVIAKGIESFVRREFSDCNFVIEWGYTSEIVIKLLAGPYDLVIRGCLSAMNGYPADELEIRSNVAPLLKGSKRMFEDIIKHINNNHRAYSSVLYRFEIGKYYVYRGDDYKPGSISKPTKIEHKTFKGRKRRSVAEAILGGFSCDC